MPRALPEQLGALWPDNKKTLKCLFRFLLSLFFPLCFIFNEHVGGKKKRNPTANRLPPLKNVITLAFSGPARGEVSFHVSSYSLAAVLVIFLSMLISYT